jgi:hypothetical protein
MNARIYLFLLAAIGIIAASSPYLVVVDSTSMRYMVSGSQTTFMEETQAGLGSFVDSSGNEIGIIYSSDCDTWGDTGSGGVKLLQGLTADKAALHGAIDSMGETSKKPSVGSALTEAKSYLVSAGQKANIVLITYDMGDCGDIDPESVAAEIYDNGNGVGKVSVIGFMGAGGDGEKKAKAVATAGGGKYYHINAEGDAANALAGIPQLSGSAAASTSQGDGQTSGTSGESGSQGQGGICPSGFILLPLAALVFLRQRAG